MYENHKCPYCGKTFAKEDDVVVCPVCGTPHHRDCWKEHGECANADKHSSGYSYNASAESDDEAEPKSEEDFIAEIQREIDNENKAHSENESNDSEVCSRCGAKLIDGCTYCLYCGQEKGKPVIVGTGRKKNNCGKDPLGGVSPEEEANGFGVSEMAKVVRNKPDKFIPRFVKLSKRKNKLSWNWCAFLFGYFYFFYRKMYKWGALIIIATLLVFNVSDILFGSPVSSFENLVYENVYASEREGDYSAEAMKTAIADAAAETKEGNPNVLYKAVAVYAVKAVLINVTCGLLANYLYMKKCSGVIAKIKESAAIMGGMNRRDYNFNLIARGGVNVFSIIVAYFAEYFISSVFSYLISLF